MPFELQPTFREFFDEALASGGAFLVTDRRTGAVIGSTTPSASWTTSRT